jgi:short-subunit dehydrogenase
MVTGRSLDGIKRTRKRVLRFSSWENLATTVVRRNVGGAIANVFSVLSWVTAPTAGTYSTSKAAAWALTNGLRTGLREQGTQVLGLRVGPVDTDMASQLTLPKFKPVNVVRQVLSAIEAGRDEVLADDMTRQLKAGLSNEVGIYLNFDPERAVPATNS